MAAFLLVHGAGHGAWCWSRVVRELEGRGHTALATDQPGLGDDKTPTEDVTWDATVAKLSADLQSIEGPVIVVGHSMGGTLTAQLAQNHPDKVSAAIYLAATLPADGESTLSNSIADISMARVFFALDELGLAWEESLKLYPAILYGGCDQGAVAEAMPRLRPQPPAVFGGTVTITAEREGTVPRYYIETLRDLVITPGAQREMYAKRPCAEVFTLDTGHSPMYSAPAKLADVLDKVAGAVHSG